MMTPLSRSAPISKDDPSDVVMIPRLEYENLQKIKKLVLSLSELKQVLGDWTDGTMSVSFSDANGKVIAFFESLPSIQEAVFHAEAILWESVRTLHRA